MRVQYTFFLLILYVLSSTGVTIELWVKQGAEDSSSCGVMKSLPCGTIARAQTTAAKARATLCKINILSQNYTEALIIRLTSNLSLVPAVENPIIHNVGFTSLNSSFFISGFTLAHVHILSQSYLNISECNMTDSIITTEGRLSDLTIDRINLLNTSISSNGGAKRTITMSEIKYIQSHLTVTHGLLHMDNVYFLSSSTASFKDVHSRIRGIYVRSGMNKTDSNSIDKDIRSFIHQSGGGIVIEGCNLYNNHRSISLRIDEGLYANISDCLISNNIIDGIAPIVLYRVDYVRLESSKIINNQARDGGISMIGCKEIDIHHVIIDHNVGKMGAGLSTSFSRSGTMNIHDSTLSNNKGIAGKGDNMGGGMYVSNEGNQHADHISIRVKMHNCSVYNNDATQGGGGYIVNAVVHADHKTTFVKNNAKQFGGGLQLITSSFLGDHSKVSENNALDGGGVYVLDSILSSVDVFQNTASRAGGGVYVSGDSKIRESTIHGNNGPFGGGLVGLVEFATDKYDQLIVYNNTAEQHAQVSIKGKLPTGCGSRMPMNMDCTACDGICVMQNTHIICIISNSICDDKKQEDDKNKHHKRSGGEKSMDDGGKGGGEHFPQAGRKICQMDNSTNSRMCVCDQPKYTTTHTGLCLSAMEEKEIEEDEIKPKKVIWKKNLVKLTESMVITIYVTGLITTVIMIIWYVRRWKLKRLEFLDLE